MNTAPHPADNQQIVKAFVAAFNRHDIEGVMALMSDDCVFESSSPAPDGARYVGREQVRMVWEALFRDRPTSYFEEEEYFASGDRAFARWKLKWTVGSEIKYTRGIDIIRIKNGKITEKLTYSKK